MDAFKLAATVCAARRHDSAEVCALLRHWSISRGAEIRTARKMWFEKKDERSSCSSIQQYLLRIDRAAQTTYELTGDFGLSHETAAVGSVVMFDNPDTTAPLDDDESVLSTAVITDVLEIAETNNCTVVEGIERLHLENCRKNASWAKKNQVVVELHHKAVENAVAEIASHHPWSMSWSNVLDYDGKREFYRITRACSKHGDTIHFGYSMNWTCDVRWAHPIDFNDEEHKSTRTSILQSGLDTLLQVSKIWPGVSRRFRHPPPTNPLNPAGYALGVAKNKQWIDHFIGIGKETGPCNVGNSKPCLWNPLSHTGDSTIHLTWTYDAEIKFS